MGARERVPGLPGCRQPSLVYLGSLACTEAFSVLIVLYLVHEM